MTGPGHLVTRADRLLDAAADLLVRWGYQRVTVADVAAEAGIGKGTVYLHHRTKEALFLGVLLRIHGAVLLRMAERMERDPAAAMPARAVRELYRELLDDPVTRRIYLGDAEVLGRLAHEASETLGAIAAVRARMGREWFGLLREAGLLRTDQPVDAQLRVFAAVTTGFFLLDGVPTAPGPADPDARADLLADTLRAALELPGTPDRALAARIAHAYRTHTAELDRLT
ncbi:TetR/AcrR family transcriptional regulator [Pseudonocardia oroxyli]|uniref:Transcriptional regulator, TetR family n=1 Tax=Pseudonocardia oroxyli TaxID=366584 RepID=A0A1G7N513_PSEOR|nr:TetR/AcrR family transcriptional regulator [Pseudonocardia oroxyli]SDF69123.1 transcriptional regulator, TetR family [Pseudonocardia oroxyli]